MREGREELREPDCIPDPVQFAAQSSTKGRSVLPRASLLRRPREQPPAQGPLSPPRGPLSCRRERRRSPVGETMRQNRTN